MVSFQSRLLHVLATLTLCALFCAAPISAERPSANLDRSPVDLALAPDGAWLVSVNQTSNSISLVRTSDGRILDEQIVGKHPAAIALHPDGRRVLVSCAYSGELMLFQVEAENLRRLWRLHVGFEPIGVAFHPGGKTAYVALSALGEVAVIDVEKPRATSHIAVGRWPRYLCVTPDGKRLAVGVSGDRGVAVVDIPSQKLLQVDKFTGLNVGHLHPSADSTYAHFPWIIYRRNPITPGNIRLGWVLASRLARIKLDSDSRREAFSLDPRGEAVADPHGIDLTPDEKHIVVSASGTRELLVFRDERLPYHEFGSTDHIDRRLLRDSNRFFRITVGGRPMGLVVAPDGRTVYVANYIENAIQVVDLKERKLTRSMFLGGPQEPSLARRGEAMFYDARRSLDQWYSCHSCHYDGGSNAIAMDTLNDGSPATFKTVLPLFHTTSTGPWTWHGWQKDFKEGVKKSFTTTMQGPTPSVEDLAALTEYLRKLEPPPNPFRSPDGSLTAIARRGEKVFHSERAGCANCHSGPYFTDGEVHDVGLGKPSDRYQGFNTPTLLGLYRKVHFLHDGRAKTLEQLLTGPHAPEKVTGSGALSDTERKELIAYLKSL